MQYRIHNLRISVNGISFEEVWIDVHYEEKHKSSMNDEIILELIKALNLRTFLPTAVSESGKKFFVNEP